MENKENKQIELPDNAFRELKPGEEYEPVMSPKRVYPEVTPWSVTWGILMAVLFSAAAAYLGLKVGQVFEAAIHIAIIAIGVSTATHRKNALGENVIIQSIGACSGAVVAGAIFVLPAIYMLNLQAGFLKVFIASALGGILGILLGFGLSAVATTIISGLTDASLTVRPSAGAVAVAFGVSVGIGVLFGYLPAKKAAALNPIDALRSE